MNVFYSGAAAILAGVIILAIIRNRTKDSTIEVFLNHMRKLTPDGQTALDTVSEGDDPAIHSIMFSNWDARTVFFNSRMNVRIANRARLCEPTDRELHALFETLQEDHKKLRVQFLLTLAESFIGRLGLGIVPMYAPVLLWTYAEELELLSQISDKCGPLERNAIRAIL